MKNTCCKMNVLFQRDYVKTGMESESQRVEPLTDVKFQNIIYYCWDGKKQIDSDSNTKIDFIGAMNAMKNIDYAFDKNYIGFNNLKNNELVQFIRIDKTNWYADIPIDSGVDWDGYYWAGHGSTVEIAEMLKLFFEEVSWFDSISWVMRRHKL